MKVGAEPKKLAALGGLALVGGYLFYANVISQPGSSAPPRRAAQPSLLPGAAPVATPPSQAATSPRRAQQRVRQSDEFRPSLKPRRPEDRPDPMSIDPTLRLDLLAKVQSVSMEGGKRNLFQFSAPPPPPAALKGPEPKVIPKTPAQVAQEQAQQKAAEAAAKPPPPPIDLKYYGYASARGDSHKRAFFLDGEDILVAGEGEVVKRRYRVVRIGVNSVVMEDTELKNQQTLQLQTESIV